MVLLSLNHSRHFSRVRESVASGAVQSDWGFNHVDIAVILSFGADTADIVLRLSPPCLLHNRSLVAGVIQHILSNSERTTTRS